jgi:hypothetical protein
MFQRGVFLISKSNKVIKLFDGRYSSINNYKTLVVVIKKSE